MKSLFWILTLFALAVGVSLAMRVNEGYLLLVLQPYRVQVSLNLAALLVLFGFVVCHVLLRAVALASSLPRRIRESRARRQREKAAAIFAEGVRLYLAGERRKTIDTLAGLRGEGGWTALAAAFAAHVENELGGVGKRPEPQASAADPDPPPVVIAPNDQPAQADEQPVRADEQPVRADEQPAREEAGTSRRVDVDARQRTED
jgi:HemY protein